MTRVSIAITDENADSDSEILKEYKYDTKMSVIEEKTEEPASMMSYSYASNDDIVTI